MSSATDELFSSHLPRDIPSAVQRVLKEAILKGELAAGSRIKIDELAARFGVSKIPVREALRMLESDGWVTSQPHKGTYVRSLTQQELSEIFEMRKLMEPRSAKLAAARRTPEQLAKLESLIGESKKAIEKADLDAITDLNKRLHMAIAEAAGNSLLTESLEKLDLLMRRYFMPVSWDQRRDSMKQHEAIVQAIVDQDEGLAEKLTMDHVCHTEALASTPMTNAVALTA
ncbi:GntR family transcriptional regulator [Pigmentiphaga sp. H8]|uniref:GntR family transcriptional regulator n=1 Tax=Pigmentiphaga sp. H8 TaxID=2488560 RepID=UPI000F5A6C1E|nr:GntR family transcriptional regulator [Pigmentiphaga sp. H8]AZG11161.1 GntR family transcriptional regulator [Pigmentiphaga sp. H8]